MNSEDLEALCALEYDERMAEFRRLSEEELDRSTGQEVRFSGTWRTPIAPAVATGGGTIDSEARSALNDLIDRLIDAGILRIA